MADPAALAKNFVQQYYNAFDSNRQTVAQLYQAGSHLSFEGENADGQMPIVQKVSALQLPPGAKHVVATVDAQPSGAGSNAVIVLVTGQYVGQLYQEVFHLVPTPQSSYYIHNHIFRVGRNTPFNTPAAGGGEVAKAFLQHYYTMFDTNRDGLVPLYRNQSILTVNGEHKRGVNEIMAKLRDLPKVAHDGNSFTIDSQSVNGTQIIVVFVTGMLSIDMKNPLKFTQLFQLVQEGQQYAVINDVFQLNYG